ncbi:MAG: tetratricopeptide repeat protein [Thermoplasmata archaeon]
MDLAKIQWLLSKPPFYNVEDYIEMLKENPYSSKEDIFLLEFNLKLAAGKVEEALAVAEAGIEVTKGTYSQPEGGVIAEGRDRKLQEMGVAPDSLRQDLQQTSSPPQMTSDQKALSSERFELPERENGVPTKGKKKEKGRKRSIPKEGTNEKEEEIALLEKTLEGNLTEELKTILYSIVQEPSQEEERGYGAISLHKARGLALHKLGRTEEAIEEFENLIQRTRKAIEEGRIKWHVLFTLALLYISKEKYDKALVLLEECLKKDPDDTSVMFEYAVLLHKLGRSEDADRHFSIVVEKAGPNLTQRIKLIDQLVGAKLYPRAIKESLSTYLLLREYLRRNYLGQVGLVEEIAALPDKPDIGIEMEKLKFANVFTALSNSDTEKSKGYLKITIKLLLSEPMMSLPPEQTKSAWDFFIQIVSGIDMTPYISAGEPLFTEEELEGVLLRLSNVLNGQNASTVYNFAEAVSIRYPKSRMAHILKVGILTPLGKEEELKKEFERYVALNPEDRMTLVGYSGFLKKHGRQEDLAKFLSSMFDKHKTSLVSFLYAETLIENARARFLKAKKMVEGTAEDNAEQTDEEISSVSGESEEDGEVRNKENKEIIEKEEKEHPVNGSDISSTQIESGSSSHSGAMAGGSASEPSASQPPEFPKDSATDSKNEALLLLKEAGKLLDTATDVIQISFATRPWEEEIKRFETLEKKAEEGDMHSIELVEGEKHSGTSPKQLDFDSMFAKLHELIQIRKEEIHTLEAKLTAQ